MGVVLRVRIYADVRANGHQNGAGARWQAGIVAGFS
jgi:hypothetical protein